VAGLVCGILCIIHLGGISVLWARVETVGQGVVPCTRVARALLAAGEDIIPGICQFSVTVGDIIGAKMALLKPSRLRTS
jgi:hypothetical protein